MSQPTSLSGTVSVRSRKTKRPALLASAVAGALLPCVAHAYSLPVRGDSLAQGEMFITAIHSPGIQAEGKDITARRHVTDSSWSLLKTDGADPKVLTNYVDYGKPVYAMAPGTVVGCWRNAPQNTPGSMRSDVGTHIAGGGNHFWFRQDDGVYALYAHMQPGSLPAGLCPHNATFMTNAANSYGSATFPDIAKEVWVSGGVHVNAGTFLGLVGDSGASAQIPHLHVHMEKNGVPVVMTFDRGMTEPFPSGTGDLDGPWTRLAGHAMPKADILFWPPHPIGYYTFNGTPAADYQSFFDHLADSGMMPSIVTCANNGATYNANWVPSQGQWVSYHGMSATDFLTKNAQLSAQGFTRTSTYTCGTVTVAVWRK
jgi:Bacterial tandem repeat domain 1